MWLVGTANAGTWSWHSDVVGTPVMDKVKDVRENQDNAFWNMNTESRYIGGFMEWLYKIATSL
jgi:hypothetical protein